ncbi:hypothetical protein, partial [Propionicimonas sp.]|uniref:hypothetical protein n=1 Tax=Propionicimonas sp. TaxID=1955623 RepID=UPI0039E47B0A
GPRVVAPAPPRGRGPGRRQRGRRVAVASVLAASLLLIGILSALPVLPATSPSATATASRGPAEVVTVTPSAPASAEAANVTGGDIGAAVEFSAPTGAGTLTVTRATWTDAGEVPAGEGTSYLVLEVSVACTNGSVMIDPILLRATTAAGPSLPGFGPSLDAPLGGRQLDAGERVKGEVGYVLAPGNVDLHLLDESLRDLAVVRIPAP